MENGGLIHIYCGEGKGKTTAALGLALRCCGGGNRVLIAQFLKSRPTGELNSLKLLAGIEVMRGKTGGKFTFQMNAEEKACAKAAYMKLFERAKARCASGAVDMLILDEVIGACNAKVFDLDALLGFLREKPEKLEVVLTGRNPDGQLLALADYVSEIVKRKHPFDKGIPARAGVEN